MYDSIPGAWVKRETVLRIVEVVAPPLGQQTVFGCTLQ
jgi:hypothetical protein